MRNRLPRDPGPALNRPVGFKSLKQAGSDPFHLLLGLKFLLPCPQGLLAWRELQLAFLSTLLIHTTLLTHLPIKGTKTVRRVPGLFWKNPETRGHQGNTSLAVCHTGPDTVSCAHRLKLSFISKLSLVLWLNISSMYPGYIEKTPKHSKTFPEVVASSCVCCEHVHEHART